MEPAWWRRPSTLPLMMLVFAILIISFGGAIRIHDAGESCPDWPKCFGTYGFDISEEKLERILAEEIFSLQLVDIDPINKGPYLLETMKADKNTNKNDALNDIYKVLRPGEAPTIDIAEEVFKNLYFSKNRYDLSEVGRVKLNFKLNLTKNTKETILSKEDIVAIIKFMLNLRDGKGEVDDIAETVSE